METVFEQSAGGVVTTDDGRLVIVRTRNLKGASVLALPKGHPESGESAVEAAAREVREETGYEVSLVDADPIEVLEYWYVRDGTRVKKRVDFFRFTVTGGDPQDHDTEIDEVLTVDPAAGLEMLTYPSERDVAQKALRP